MILDYRNPLHAGPSRGKTWRTVIGWCVGGFILLLLAAIVLMPSLGRARETAKRVKCGSNLRQIGQAAMIYANDHAGAFPPDFIALYRHLEPDLTPEVLTCPSSDTLKAPGATQAQIVDSMLAGDHLDYAWTGGGLTNAATSDIILALEVEPHTPREGAAGIGMNVLFADGSVSFVDEPTAKAIWAQFVSGVRPIRMPTPAPATTAPASAQ